MSLLNIINFGLGIASQAGRNRRLEQEARAAAMERQRLMDRMLAYQDQVSKNYEQDLQSGRFDSSKRIGTINKIIEHDLTRDKQNMQAGGYGYKTGDSNPVQKARALSESARLRQAQLADAITQDAYNQKESAFSRTAPNGIAGLLGQYNRDEMYSRSRQTDPSGLISGFLDAGGMGDISGVLKGISGRLRKPTNPTSNPYKMT